MLEVYRSQAVSTSPKSTWFLRTASGCRLARQCVIASKSSFCRSGTLSQRSARPASANSCSASASFAHNSPDEAGGSFDAETLDGGQPASQRQGATAESPSLTQRVKNFFGGGKFDRKRLQALGMGAVASYGFVSNATYGTGLSISWIAFVRQTGLGCLASSLRLGISVPHDCALCIAGKSPLMAQQWKPFLALYGSFWAAQHLIRPLRFSLALAMSPLFDKFINFVQQKTHFKRQNAFAVYLFLLGSVSSICIFGSIRLFAGPMAFATG